MCTFTCTSASHFRLKFFIGLYLLTMLMDQVDTLHVARYWSEVLRSTITLGDLEVKVTDLKILCISFWLKFFLVKVL